MSGFMGIFAASEDLEIKFVGRVHLLVNYVQRKGPLCSRFNPQPKIIRNPYYQYRTHPAVKNITRRKELNTY